MMWPGKTNAFLIQMVIGANLIFSGGADALESNISGQLSGWTTETYTQENWENNTGLRYIPEVDIKQPINDDSFMDAEISLNGYVATSGSDVHEDYDLELYRAKLRFATTQTETRVGLQKINFGPARLLRPLRWFDRLDPTDPLQMTDGVYALRFKYVALNNANLWLWVLYGNEDPKGYEILPTASGNPELGGRLQYPVPRGELAATAHSRNVDGSESNVPDYSENRFAVDGRWDIGIGLWFESVIQHQEKTVFAYDWTKMITIGIDYTFGLGNGLYVVLEHMTTALSEEVLGWDEDGNISAVSLNYPIGIMDNITAIGSYSWDQKDYYQYLRWLRTYDTLALSLSLSYYPEITGNEYGLNQGINKGGYGAGFMIIFNH